MRRLLLLLCLFAAPVAGQTTTTPPPSPINTTSNPPTSCIPGKIYTNKSLNPAKEWVGTSTRACTEVSGSSGIGGSTGATDNALLRANGTGGATVQNSAVTVDDSGNVNTAGSVAAGAFIATGSTAGYSEYSEGPAPSLGTNSIQFAAPTSVPTAFRFTLPSASATGVLLGTNSSNINTLSFVAPGTSGNVLTSNGTTWTSAAAAGGPTINATDNVIPQRASSSAFTNSPITGSVPGSMVDGITVTGAATANPATVTLAATGSDSNIHFQFNRKGTSNFWFNLPDANARLVVGGTNSTATDSSNCWFDFPGASFARMICDRAGVGQTNYAGDGIATGSGGYVVFDSAQVPAGGGGSVSLNRAANGVLAVSAGYQTSDASGSLKYTTGLLQPLTVATLPAGTAGQYAYVTDGDASLAWGATVVNSGAGATKYLVWYNGTNWTVAAK